MISPEKSRYEAALAYAARKHAGQTRIGGDPYITHPVAVAEIVSGWGCAPETCIAALFHDLLEDTDALAEELLAIGGPDVLRAVRLLTKENGYVMAEYVAGIRANSIARTVKAADRLHNLRCALMTDDAFKRRYIHETIDWYMDFCSEIPHALHRLIDSLDASPEEIRQMHALAEAAEKASHL